MAGFNFLNVSPTYRASVSEKICTRRDILTAEAGFTDEFLWPTRKADIPKVKAAWAEKGITVSSDSVFKYDHGILRTTYLFLTGDEPTRAAILQKLGRKDPYHLAVGCFIKDGITSWEAVQQLAMEPVDVITEGEEVRAAPRDFVGELIGTSVVVETPTMETPTEEEEPVIPPEPEEISAPLPEVVGQEEPTTVTHVSETGREEEEEQKELEASSEVFLRLTREEFEFLKRGAVLAVQFAQENAALREKLDSYEEQIELLEEIIAGARPVGDVPELAQFLCVTNKLAAEEKELEKVYQQLPRTSPHHGGKPVVYQNRFLDEFYGLDKADTKRVVRQLKTLFNKGPRHSSLLSERLWHRDLPGTPRGSWCSRAGGGGPHGARFTWQASDTEVVVFGLYPRNDLF